MSGLLVGTDVDGALRLFDAVGPGETIHVIGAAELARVYVSALAARGHAAHPVDGGAAAFTGLGYLYRELDRTENA
jgi:2-keto-3-deoxy-galactonokinase